MLSAPPATLVREDSPRERIPRARRYVLRRRLIVALATLVALVFASGAAAIGTTFVCRRGMEEAHRYEVAARTAASLGRMAREQYIHEAHTIILGDDSHVDHHDEWVHRFRKEAAAFRADLPVEQGHRVDGILSRSAQLAAVFSAEILPAVNRGDRAAVHSAHQRATLLVDEMTAQADALADSLEERAAKETHDARQASSSMLALVAMAGVLATIFALLVARSLWGAFAETLHALRVVSERVGGGERSARVGQLPAEELAVVGLAFDGMLDILAEKERALLAAERLGVVGRVAAGVAHEINNPITVIRGYISQLRKGERVDPVREEIEIIDEEAAACQRIAEDLLAYARAPALTFEVVDAVEIAREAADRCVPMDMGGKVAITRHVDSALLRVDRVRIRQVLVNVLRNAMQVDGTEVELVGEDRGSDGYVFRVRDRGPGLGVESCERVFEPFYTTKRDGSGLGLAVCYGLVTAHGGRIHAENRPEGGLDMVVELPGRVTETGAQDG